MSTLKRIALTLLAAALPCFAWAELPTAAWIWYGSGGTDTGTTLDSGEKVYTVQNKYIDMDANGVTVPANGFTFSFWTKRAGSNWRNYAGFSDTTAGLMIQQNNTAGTMNIYGSGAMLNQAGDQKFNLAADPLQLVTFVSNAGTLYTYVNGTLNNTFTPSTTVWPSFSQNGQMRYFALGAAPSTSGTSAGNGGCTTYIADARVYNVALTAEQVKELYDRAANRLFTGNGNWSDTGAWKYGKDQLDAPAASADTKIYVEQDSTITMNAAATLNNFTINGVATATFDGANKLEVATTAINTNVDVSAIEAKLGAATVTSGKTLTVDAWNQVTSAAGDGTIEVTADSAYTNSTIKNILINGGKLTSDYVSNSIGIATGRTITVDGASSELAITVGDGTGWGNAGDGKLIVKNEGVLSYTQRDTLCVPIELMGGTILLKDGMAGNSGRALDLYLSTADVMDFTVLAAEGATEANPTVSYLNSEDQTVDSDDRLILLRDGDCKIDVATNAKFVIDAEFTTTMYNAGGTRGKIVKSGNGVLEFAGVGTSDYDTETEINAGTIKLCGASTLGSGAVSVASGATLAVEIGNKQTKTLENAISDSGAIAVNAGELVLTGANGYYTGTITVANDATLKTTGPNASPFGTTNEIVNNGSVIVASDANATPSIAKLSGSGSLTVNSGTLTLTGANTYTGKTTIAKGATLIANSGTANTWNFDANNHPDEIEVLGTLKLQSVGNDGIYRRITGTGEVVVSGNSRVGNASAQTNTGLSLFAGKLTVKSGVTLTLPSWNASQTYTLSGCDLTVDGQLSGGGNMGVAINIASGKTLSGSGTIVPNLTFADGAILNATAATAEKCLTAGAVTLSGALKINATGRAEGDAVLTCTSVTGLDTANITVTGVDGMTVEHNGTALVLVAEAVEPGVTTVGTAEALTAALTGVTADKTIQLTTAISLTETLVIDVGEGNTVTIDLAGNTISYFGAADDGVTGLPAVKVISGTLALTTSNQSITELTDYVMALDNTILLSGGALVVDEGVSVKTSGTTAVSVTSGTIGGSGSIYGGLNLEDGTTIDATNGHLTIAGSGIVQFPGEVSDGMGGTRKSTVTFRMPDGLVYPQEIIKCANASADHAPGATLCVNNFLHNNYALTVMLDNQTGKPSAYGLSQYVCSADDRNYTSVAAAIRAGETYIELRANTKEDIVIPEDVTLLLANPYPYAAYTVKGNVTVKSGATLEPFGGDIEGNLILEDGATLSVYMEVGDEATYDFHVSGTVTFPENGLTIIAGNGAAEVDLGEPRQIISTDTLLPVGADVTTKNLEVVTSATSAPVTSVKILSTSYTYEIVDTDSGTCTLDGIDYADINQALGAYSARGNKMLKLKSAPPAPTETLVIDVDDPTTDEIEEITIDLNGLALAATLENGDPTIRIKSGDVWLISTAADNTYTQVSSTYGTAIVVGADANGDATEKAALHIDDSVQVLGTTDNYYAVDMVSGTLSGDATLTGNLNLQDGVTIDASAGALTMGSMFNGLLQYNVTFPGTTGTAGTITVIPPVGATQATFIHCAGADAGNHANTNVQVVLTETDFSTDYEIIETYETVDETQIPTGYAVWVGEHAAATIVGEVIAYHATFAAAVDAVTTAGTGTIILLSDLTLETDVAADIYTNGFNITTEGARAISGKLTLSDGTQLILADTLTVEEVELVEYADASVAGTITSTGDVTIKGTLSGMYTINGNVVLTDGAGLVGYAGVTSVTVSEGATVTIDATVNTNLTVNNATVNGTGTIEIGEGKTLAGAGTINTTVILDNGATVDTCGYESNFLVLTALTALTEDALITVKADTLSNVINAKGTTLNATNFTLTLADGSAYEAYNPGTPQALDTDAELLIPVVATRNGENCLGIVRLRYYLAGAQIADPEQGDAYVSVAKQLAAYGYRYGILEIKGVDTASSDPVAGYQLFTKVLNGFVGDYVVLNYDFGITDISVMALTDGEVTSNYVVVTADVDGPYDPDPVGCADYRTGTRVELYQVTADESGNEVLTLITEVVDEQTVALEPLTLDEAIDCGLVETGALALPAGVKYFIVPLDAAPTEGSKSLKFKVKATNEVTE